jgi:hypothetical protein
MRYCFAVVLLLFALLRSHAQRYGRPDGAQNYGRVENQQLLLQVSTGKKKHYFRTSDLKKMSRVHVTATDPNTKVVHQ